MSTTETDPRATYDAMLADPQFGNLGDRIERGLASMACFRHQNLATVIAKGGWSFMVMPDYPDDDAVVYAARTWSSFTPDCLDLYGEALLAISDDLFRPVIDEMTIADISAAATDGRRREDYTDDRDVAEPRETEVASITMFSGALAMGRMISARIVHRKPDVLQIVVVAVDQNGGLHMGLRETQPAPVPA